eukprot:1159407-Pelagomonas_calceolata.AAC.4
MPCLRLRVLFYKPLRANTQLLQIDCAHAYTHTHTKALRGADAHLQHVLSQLILSGEGRHAVHALRLLAQEMLRMQVGLQA